MCTGQRKKTHSAQWCLPHLLCFPLDRLFFVHTSAVKVPVEGSISILPQRFHPQAVCIQALMGGGDITFLKSCVGLHF